MAHIVSLLNVFSKQVTCLSVSLDGTKLASGSHDCTVKIFDVFSGQCVRTLNHKGEINCCKLRNEPRLEKTNIVVSEQV